MLASRSFLERKSVKSRRCKRIGRCLLCPLPLVELFKVQAQPGGRHFEFHAIGLTYHLNFLKASLASISSRQILLIVMYSSPIKILSDLINKAKSKFTMHDLLTLQNEGDCN